MDTIKLNILETESRNNFNKYEQNPNQYITSNIPINNLTSVVVIKK